MSINWEKSAEYHNKSIIELKAYFEKFSKSNKKIFVICDECKYERLIRYNTYQDHGLCLSCIQKGKHFFSKINQKIFEKMIIDYKNGLSFRDLSKKYNYSSATIYNKFKKMNIKIQSKSEINLLNLPIEKIILDYQNGLSFQKIAEKYNTTDTTIMYRIKKSGIKIRSISEALKNKKNI